MLAIVPPFTKFDNLVGFPLQAGFVYIGVANDNPRTNPVDVFWDIDGTQPAAQPLRTQNGMIMRAGTPANVFCSADYSMEVVDATGARVFYARSAASISNIVELSQEFTDLTVNLTNGTYSDTVTYVTNVLVVDDAIGITNLAAANPGRRILNRRGAALNFLSKARISSDGIIIDLNGGYILQQTADMDSLEFSPPTVGVTSAYLNTCGLENGYISHANVAATSTTGAGLSIIQCNGFRLRDVTFSDGDVYVKGGQLNSITGCKFFASHGTYRGDGSACLHIMAAPYSGLYQAPFTIDILDWKGSATELRETIMRVHEGDGVTISGGGYGAFGKNSIILLMASRVGSYWGACSVEGNYLDCVNPTTGTLRCIEFRDNAALGVDTSTLFGLAVCQNWMGNGAEVAILGRKKQLSDVHITDNEIINMVSWGIDIDTLGSSSVIHVDINRFGNNGDGVSGAMRIVGGGNSVDVVGNHLTSTSNLCLQLGGAWQVGTICGNTNGAPVADIALVAGTTFAGGLMMSGNASLYTGAVVDSWCVTSKKLQFMPAFANDAAAAAGGIPVGGLYRIANAVQIRLV